MDNTKVVEIDEFSQLLKKFSGMTRGNEPNAVVSYEMYALEDPEEKRGGISTLSRAEVTMSLSKMYPGFVSFDISFASCDDTELKLLWGKLQRLKKLESSEPEKTWIFHFNMIERASISFDTDVDDELFICDVLNPAMSYLTRSWPGMLASNKLQNGELTGGNVIKMLVSSNLVSFERTGEYETSKMKGESRRAAEESAFLDGYTKNPDSENIW